MRRTAVWFTCAVIALSASSASAQFKGGGGAGWLPSLAEGKAQASKSGKPIMAVVRCVP
jgi:hypothetical protein